MYNLSKAALQSEDLAYTSALVFCWSPANPFFLSLYTESTFAFFSFSGIYLASYGPSDDLHRLIVTLVSSLCFAVASSIRSNGVVMAGFIVYPALCRAYHALIAKRWTTVATSVLECSVGSLVSVTPFLVYLYTAYQRYCVGFTRPWCEETVPNIYSFVQSFYWNVGFLRYFRPHQIPNFLLAAPVLILAFSAAISFLKSDWRNALSLGINSSAELTADRTVIRRYSTDTIRGFYRNANFVFVAHLLALLATSVPFIHIQVLTRFLFSQCPILYWYVAHLLSDHETSTITKKSIVTYMLVFNLMGIILFSNFLPWT